MLRVPRRVFRRFLDGAMTPERSVEAYHLQCTRFERVAERKLRDRQLTSIFLSPATLPAWIMYSHPALSASSLQQDN